jgi:anti-sigma factor RsiW
MTWTCDQVEVRLSDYLEGALQAPERAAFEAHVKECRECAPLLASVTSVVSELRSIEELAEPPRLVYAILDRTLGPRERVTSWQAFGKFILGMATPKFAYGAVSVMATLIIVLSASGVSLRKPKLADLQPAAIVRSMDRKVHVAKASAVKYVSDLRVVYEIQSRLRQENELQVTPDDKSPKSNPGGKPDRNDDHTRTQPKQENRAREFAHEAEMLAALCPILLERSYR